MIDLFNIYYINFQKVYEIAMMEDNRIITTITTEDISSINKSSKIKSKLSNKAGFYLTSVAGEIGAEDINSSTKSSKFVESIDIKTTKSILLHRIIRKCMTLKNFETVNEGDLVKIDNVTLKIMDESSLRQFLLLRRDVLKGLRVEGIEINNIVTSILSDYSYILVGEVGNDSLVIKIPTEAKNEFESKYNIDDLLIGKVSIIGVYKDFVSEKFISKNTFNYFAEIGSNLSISIPEQRIITSNESTEENITLSPTNYSDEKTLRFIDLFAIIQDVKHKKMETSTPKKCFFRRLFCGDK